MSNFENDGSANYGLIVLIAILAAVVSAFVTYKATATNSGKIAVLDVDRVAEASKSAQALQKAREGQLENLQKMTEDAEIRLKAEEDADQRKRMSEIYVAEINSQKEEYDQQYFQALKLLNQSIKETASEIAAKKGIKVIMLPNSLFQGGEDITDLVIQNME
ncbi:MAG: OmpH family outer membrane protein [Alphaproteobacteria bacterium]|nr:OmpH family outer membrane protein [Alphaproteobacteria bacterium]